jgi:hypothetical protein
MSAFSFVAKLKIKWFYNHLKRNFKIIYAPVKANVFDNSKVLSKFQLLHKMKYTKQKKLEPISESPKPSTTTNKFPAAE